MSAVKNVLIVGGGLAGLSLARALGMQQITVDVLEVMPEPQGAAISIMYGAVKALEELGVLAEVQSEGKAVPRHFSFYNASGEPLGPKPSNGVTDEPIIGGVTIERPILSGILNRAAKDVGANIIIGTTVSAMEQDADGVTVTLTDGTSRLYDLVVGADGLNSAVRKLLFNNDYVPQYTGEISFRWVFPANGLDIPGGFYIVGNRLVGVVPLANDKYYVTSGITLAEKKMLTQEEVREILRSTLGNASAPGLLALKERLSDDVPIVVKAYDWLFVNEDWFKGRVIIIGDAAHATTANLASGGGMAIEDAVVLAQSLKTGNQIEAAFPQFMSRRFPRTKFVVDTSVELMKMHQQRVSQVEQEAVRANAVRKLTEEAY